MAACAGLGVFAAAASTAWLFVARGLQGLAVGMISGTATAGLVELEPDGGDPRRPALLAGVAQAGGSAVGAVAAGSLAEWAPAPTRLCYLVALGVTAVAAAFVARVPEAAGGGEPWRIQWPRVPAEVRADFVRVGLTAGAAWGAAALFFSIVPSYASRLLDSRNLALLGAIAAVALAGSCIAQAAARHADGSVTRVQGGGLLSLAAGLMLLVLAAPLSSLTLLLAGGLAVGAGHGLAVFAAQDELNALAPGARRGEVTAAFVCCIYLVVAVAVISTGLLDLRITLTAAVAAVASALAAAALATAAWQLASGR